MFVSNNLNSSHGTPLEMMRQYITFGTVEGLFSKNYETFNISDSDSLFTKFYNKESVSKAVSIQT